jgi:hypothetical protein
MLVAFGCTVLTIKEIEMPAELDSSLDKRIVLKVPVYMPELRNELSKYPENCRAKRLLQLASIGLLMIEGRTAVELGTLSTPNPLPSSIAGTEEIRGTSVEPIETGAGTLSESTKGLHAKQTAAPTVELQEEVLVKARSSDARHEERPRRRSNALNVGHEQS